MNNALATTETSIVPQADADAFDKLETILTDTQTQLKSASNLRRAAVMAKAMKMIKNAITKDIMSDFKELMNTPNGFKTDRPPGTKKKGKDGKVYDLFYNDEVIKACIIQALLKGAMVVGNEFNIIAGQAYLTKEFYEAKIKSHVNVRDFKLEIGPPVKHGEKSAILEGVATWKDANGNPEKIELVNKAKLDPPGLDMRIVVNAFHSSSPDEIRGKAESKLLRRAYAQMTGEPIEEDPDDNVIDGTVIENVKSEPVEDKSANNLDEAVKNYLIGVGDEFSSCDRIGDCSKVARDKCGEVGKKAWPADVQDKARTTIAEYRDARIQTIRSRN